MVLDGLGGEEEVGRNLGVGAARGDQGEDLNFPRSEVGGVGSGSGTWSAGNVPGAEVVQPPFHLAEGWSRSELLKCHQGFTQRRLLVTVGQRPRSFIGTAKGAPCRGRSRPVAADLQGK